MKNINAGDKVYCLVYGWGRVDHIRDPDTPLTKYFVDFDGVEDEFISYDREGQFDDRCNRTLYKRPPCLSFHSPSTLAPTSSRETTFENAELGDKVYDIAYGPGLISAKYPAGHLTVEFNLHSHMQYDESGCPGGSTVRRLYWDIPEIIAPVRPKRKIKKNITHYVNVFKKDDHYYSVTYQTAQDARMGIAYQYSQRVVEARPVELTWEEEE